MSQPLRVYLRSDANPGGRVDAPYMDRQRDPEITVGARGVAKQPRHRGALSFGYFSLGKQRKVTRQRAKHAISDYASAANCIPAACCSKPE